MKTSPRFYRFALLCIFLLMMSAFVQAQDPDGGIFLDEASAGIGNDMDPVGAVVNDQKRGALLVYNFYTSSASNLGAENTRINITNISQDFGVAVHLFFVDGDTCSVADSYICLTANQTATLLASDVDPGVSGFLIAIATGQRGFPIAFNALIGDAYVKTASGYYANLGAIAFTNSTIPIGAAFPASTTATIAFSARRGYGQLPRVLAINSIPSPADGFESMVVVNRIGGSLVSGIAPIGNLFGLLFDDQEQPYSFTARGNCQLRSVLNDAFPRTTPRLSKVIPAGRTGWAKFWATELDSIPVQGGSILAERGILGAVLYKNTPQGLSGGHNLHALTLTVGTPVLGAPIAGTPTLEVPVFPSNGCY